MDRQEAIKWLNEQKYRYVSSDPYFISLDMAINALEKQMIIQEELEKLNKRGSYGTMTTYEVKKLLSKFIIKMGE